MTANDLKYSNPEQFERICQKSLKATGKKWAWRSIMQQFALTPDQVEKSLDIKIERNEAYIKQLEEHFGKLKAGQMESLRERSDTSEGDEYFGGMQVRIDGQEVRSGEANDGSTSTGGSD